MINLANLSRNLQEKSDREATGSSLRAKINLIFCSVSLLVLGVLVIVQIQAARSSVREEITASNRVATQLLRRVTILYGRKSLPALVEFLGDTGRIRANEVRVTDADNRVLYVSPPPSYKFGRFAPDWYASLVSPESIPQTIPLSDGQLTVTPNPSRSVLDAWDDLKLIFLIEAAVLLFANGLMMVIVGRWLAPLDQIHTALRDIETGHHAVRLPALPGKEAGEMGRAFNRMAQAVEDNIEVRQISAEVATRLATHREFTALLQQRIEEERAALARELHDELGQSLTAIRSIAKSMMHYFSGQNHPLERSAQMLFETAGLTADAMQRMIPRLRPIQLDGMGLTDALRDLIAEWQITHPQLTIEHHLDTGLVDLPELCEISIYRIVQEALTNVVRHAAATRVVVHLRRQPSPVENCLRLTVSDNGTGSTATLIRAGHYGVRGMQERAESLGGNIEFHASAEGGLEVDVTIPLAVGAQAPDDVQQSDPPLKNTA